MLQVEIGVGIGARDSATRRMDADRAHEGAEMKLLGHRNSAAVASTNVDGRSRISTSAAFVPKARTANLRDFDLHRARRVLHLTAERNHVQVALQFNILEPDDGILRDRALEADILRQPDRQRADRRLRTPEWHSPTRQNHLRHPGSRRAYVFFCGRNGIAAELLR